jgi:hypothetical protein
MRRVLKTFVLLPCLAVAVQAATISYIGALTGAKENPSNTSPGTGEALVVYDTTLHTLRVMVDFRGLEGDTTIAHIHCCVDPPGNTSPATPTPTFPGFPVGVRADSYDLTDASSFNSSFITGAGLGTVAGAEAALVAGLNAGRAYFNIHTTAYPTGEIRDFLAVVPEPHAILMFGTAGLLGLAFRLRRRKP